MEQDEMKLAWKELNEKINASSLVNKKTLRYILENRRKTVLQKLLLVDKSAFLFIFLFTIALSYLMFCETNGVMLIKIQTIGLLFIVCAFNLIGYLKLKKMNLNESVLVLYKQVSSYKRFTIWVYLITYILVFIFIWSFSLTYPLSSFVRILICLIVPACIVIDFLIFHWSSNHIRTLIDTSKELEELNEQE